MSNEYNGKKRSELPDSVFGIPQERKYPMPDEKHTRSAIKLFNHVDPKYEKQLAKAVIKNMKKYGIDGSVVGPNNRLRKYLPKDMIKESSIEEGFLKSDKDIYYNAKVPKSTKLYHASPSQNLKIIYPNNKSLDPNICNDAVFASSDRRYAACFGTIWSNDHARMGSFDGWRTVVFATDGTIDLDSPCSLYELYNDGSFININKNEMVSYKEARVKTEHKYKSFKSMLIDLKIEIVSMKDYISMMKESYIEEGYFKSTDNLEFNLDKWSKSGLHNLLYITGISGSGKTTLAKEMCKRYKAEYIELDKFTLGIVKGLDRWFENVNNGTYEVHPLLEEYFSHLDHLTTNGSWSKPDMGDEHTKFLTWLVNKVKGNGTLYIVEGAQFFMKLSNMDPDLIKGEPLIVVGTSAFKSWVRRIKRDTANDETISRFIYHLKKDVPMLFKYYFSNEKDLQKYIKNMQSNINESYVEESSHNKIYHLSQTNLDGKTIQPTVPSNYMTKNGYEDSKTKRVCFATSIDGCLRGLSLKCEGMKLFVHVPDGNYNIYKPSNKEVPDASITGEVWIKKAVKMKCIGQIYVIGDKGEDGIPYKYGDKTAELYDWEWKWIDKFNESSSILPQDTGISTVIFDIGDVLVSANIKDYLIADPEVPNEIVDELLKLWFIDKDEVDDTMDLDTYREIVNKRMGVEFSKYIPKLFQYNIDCVTAFDYTIPMIQDLKDKGYKVYYLSNWSAWTYDLLQEAGKFDFLKLMDGGVFSYDAGYMKPNEEIYKILLNKYKINPEEAVFFDDREENIEAANKLGIHGVHFPRHDSSIVYNNLYGRKLSKAISEYTYLSYPFNPSYNEKAVGNIVARILEFELGTDPMSPDMGVSLQEFTKTGAQIGKAEIEDIRAIIDSLEDDSFDDFKFKDIVYCDIKYKAKKPIAFITIRVKNINNSTVGYVSLAVDPKYQNQGIGKSLTTKAVSWFKKEKGIDFLEWHCLQDNEASKKLASDAGFREYIAKNNDEYIRYTMESSIQEYGTTGGTIVGSNQPDSVYIVNYMQNNVFSGYKEPKRAICKKGMNQMYTTNSGKAIPVDIDKFKEEASNISIFKFKGTPVLSYDQIIENASTDNDFYLLLTGDSPEAYGDLEYDNRFVQEENFFDELRDITFCTESTITGQIESSNYPYMKILTESMDGRSWNFYRDINGVFAMNELTGLRTPSYENTEDIPKSQIKLIERGTVYFGD